MPTKRTCPQCGAALPDQGWEGLCPKCLVRVSLEASAPIESAQVGQLREGESAANPSPAQSDTLTEQTGMIIGRYKLLRQIGEGGFGVVFMAEQTEPVQRKVALKIIKAGMDTREVTARFEVERQALALMDHPNIARVFDGGTTTTGRPYFVMELVKGTPLTTYCDQATLSTRERLELFIDVCRAVQHAHQKGIIHRDLKPGNVLVTLQDGEPVPKVIDFGIAKALGQKLTQKTLFTRFEQMIGTPAYMSPEQAALGGLDIDTRSDIYSLGVLLYELLTGVTPLDAETLAKAAWDEIRHMIRETEPLKPSTRLRTLGDKLAEVAKHRHTEPSVLGRLIRSDLDWIVMRCLEKDRTRRYETVNGLVMDIQRHLNSEPVTAVAPSKLYRAQKFVRRHIAALATISALIALLIAGAAVSTWQAVRASRAELVQRGLRLQAEQARTSEARLRLQAEADEEKAKTEANKSQQVAQFLENMLESVGPSKAMGRDTTMLREILDKTAERADEQLKDQPEVEAQLLTTVGRAYFALDQIAEAETMFRRALTLQQTLHKGDHPDVAAALANLGTALWRYWFKSKMEEAETTHRAALAMRLRLFGKQNLEVASSLNDLAVVLRDLGKLDEAESKQCDALALRKSLLGDLNPLVANSLSDLALVLNWEHKRAAAEAICGEALAMRLKLLGNDNPLVANSLRDMAIILRDQGKMDASESMFRQALALYRNLNMKSAVTDLLRELAGIHVQQERWGDVVSDLKEGVQLYPNEHWSWYMLAPVLVQAGDLQAYDEHRRAMIAKFGGAKDPGTAERTSKACMLLPLAGDDLASAARLADEAVTVGRDDEAVAWYQMNKALAEYRLGRFSEAVEWAQKALTAPEADARRDVPAYMVLAMAYRKLDRTNDAHVTLAKGEEIALRKLPKLTSQAGGPFYDWLIAYILMGEAQALVESDPKDGVEKKVRR